MESFLNLFEESYEIHEGYSGDRKFRCVNEDRQQYLCRFFPIKRMAEASQHYNALRQFKGVEGFQQIQYILKCNDGIHGVLVFDWIEGEPLHLHLETSNQQFELGQQAGKLLKQYYETKIEHTDMKVKVQRHLIHVDKKLNEYLELGGEFEGLKELLDLYDSLKGDIQLGELVQCHGDFHASNMIIDSQGRIHLIDFDNTQVWSKDRDLKSLLFFDPIDFVKGVLSQLDISELDRHNTVFELSASPRSMVWALDNGFFDSIEYLVGQNQKIIEKLKEVNFL